MVQVNLDKFWPRYVYLRWYFKLFIQESTLIWKMQ